MPTKRKHVGSKSSSATTPYLTKRILKSAVRSGVRKAAATTMEVMGYNVVARNGWIVKVYADGQVQRVSPLPTVNRTGGLLLD